MRAVMSKLISSLAVVVAGLMAAQLAQAQPMQRAARGFIVKLKATTAPAQQQASAQAVRKRMAGIAARSRVAYLDSHPTAGARRHVLNYYRWIDAAEARATVMRIRLDPDVEWVEPNYVEKPMALPTAPNDPYFAYDAASLQWWQWYVQGRGDTQGFNAAQPGAPNMLGAWSYLNALPSGRLRAPIVVAVLDSGVRLDHPDLTGQLLPGYDFVSEPIFANDGDGLDPDPSDPGDWVDDNDKQQYPLYFNNILDGNAPCMNQDSYWHGTFTTGMLGAVADNGIGTAGLLWPLQQANGGTPLLLPVRVAGKCGATRSDIIEGMYWAAGINYTGTPTLNPHPARVISLSYGGAGECGQAYQEAIDTLARVGVLVVAAAGNGDDVSGATQAVAPANCDGALAVTALRRDGSKAAYANLVTGAGVATVGGDDYVVGSTYEFELIMSTFNSGVTDPDPYLMADAPAYYTGYAGTSFATPIVASVAAMMLSVQPQLSPAQLISGLTQYGATPFPSPAGAACSAQAPANTGHCNCSTATCGAGVLDAVSAVQWAEAQSSGSDTQLNLLLNGLTAVAPGSVNAENGWIPDRLQTAEPSGGGGGGGGLMQPVWALALALATVIVARLRRRLERV